MSAFRIKNTINKISIRPRVISAMNLGLLGAARHCSLNDGYLFLVVVAPSSVCSDMPNSLVGFLTPCKQAVA